MLNIQIIGSGCPNCLKLEELCRKVVIKNNLKASIEKITDMNTFGDFGIFITPGLVVNGKILSQGKIPTETTLIHWLSNTNN